MNCGSSSAGRFVTRSHREPWPTDFSHMRASGSANRCAGRSRCRWSGTIVRHSWTRRVEVASPFGTLIRQPSNGAAELPARQAHADARRLPCRSPRAFSSCTQGLAERAGGGMAMERRGWLTGLMSAVGFCVLSNLGLTGCGPGIPTAEAAVSATPRSADGNSCNAPEHGRVTCTVVCDDGYSACGDACTKLDSDIANCGVCGKACSNGQTCNAGVCVATCLRGQTSCGGACVDLGTDDRNCGACGNNCSLDHSSSACRTGKCEVGSCYPGWANCDHDAVNGCETNTTQDRNNCGGCGVRCAENEVCEGGHIVRCGANEHREGNACVANGCGNTDSDRSNCGACGNRCNDDEICDHGHRTRCGAGYHRDGNACVPNPATCGDTDHDRDHCGACDSKCDDDEICERGHHKRCEPGFHREGNACVPNPRPCGDTDSDRDNCGAC